MRKRIILAAALVIFLGLLLFALEVRGQSCPGDYGCAQFYRSDAWTRTGLIEHFILDPGVQGDAIAPFGDFEVWNGFAEGGCTDCPDDWGCDCTTVGGDVNSEATLLYSTNTSVRLDAGGDLNSIIFHVADYAANACYQFDFCYRGAGGTEDLKFVAGNAALTDTYNWAANTWAAFQALLLSDIGTVWTCKTAYLNTGAVAKTGYAFLFYAGTADGTFIYIDNVRFQRLDSCAVTGLRGNVLSVPVGSDQQWGHSEVLLPRVGTGPAYKTGMKLDGVDDYLSCTDGDCEMDPINWAGGGKFSVGCRVMTNTVAAGIDYIIGKWSAGDDQRSWIITRNTANIYFFISDDGINVDWVLVGMYVADSLHNFVGTFDPSGGVGACEMNIHYDAYQVITDAALTECGPIDVTADLQIGAASGANNWGGSMLECTLWKRKLTAIESNKYISPYFPGTNFGDGFFVDTCSQAASHATCSTQVCRDGTPAACQAEGTGTMACYGEQDEELDNNSFEAFTGDPSVANFDDWPAESGAVTAYLADAKHGDVSARMQGGSMTGECIIGGGADTYFEISAKQLNNGGGTIEVWLREYDTGICSNQLAITMPLITCTPGSVWNDCGALFEAATWNVATSSYAIQIVDTVDGDVLIDNVSIKEASYHTPFVHCPTGSGSVTYTNRQYELFNPLSSYIEAEGGYGYASGFCISACVDTDWVGDDGVTHQIFTSPGTAGVNNRWIINKPNSNNIQFVLYDAAGALRQYTLVTTSTNWSAGRHFIECCSNNSDNVLKAHHFNVSNLTWYDWSSAAGAGNGIQTGQAADLHIGHDNNANYLDGHMTQINLSPYSDIYPNKGLRECINFSQEPY